MIQSSYVGRFAPSPTGPLHFGSLVAALASYLDAKKAQGRWLVRMEDLDSPRCRPEHARSILDTLHAFGLNPDATVVWQSARKSLYRAALDQLRRAGKTYACACSRKEVEDSGLSGVDGPVYPGICRHLRLKDDGHAIRVITDDGTVDFVDRVQGHQSQRIGAEIGDFVLRRRDGIFSYQLAVVVDDADQGITDVVRGADLIDSTARQIYLQCLLGLPRLRYLHIPVATNAEGQKLSKQTLAPAISATHAVAMLNLALEFLGQPRQFASTPDGLLAAAIQSWIPHAIAAVRTSPMPTFPP